MSALLALLASLAVPCATRGDELKEIGDMTVGRRRFQAGLTAFIKGELQVATKELDVALALEKNTGRKLCKTPFDASFNAVRNQISVVGGCMRGLSSMNLGGGAHAVASDMERAYGKGAVCAEFRKTSVATLGVAGEDSKDELVELCELCVAVAPFLIARDERDRGEDDQAVKHLREYLAGKDDSFREEALAMKAAIEQEQGAKRLRRSGKE